MSTDNRDASGRLTKFVTKQGKGVLITRLWRENEKGQRIYADGWTRRIVRNGWQYYFPLPVKKEDAERVANELEGFLQVRANTIEQAIAKFCPEKSGLAVPGVSVATVADVVRVFKAKSNVMDVKQSTAQCYADTIRRMVATVRAHRGRVKLERGVPMSENQREAVDKCPVDVLGSHEFLADFKTAMLAGTEDNRVENKGRKRTVNAYLRNTRALFHEEARRHYKAAGLNVPPLPALKEEAVFRKVDKKYALPEVRVINAVMDLGRELKEGTKREPADMNAYLAWLLALHGGLRQQEIANCRRVWFSETAPWRIRIQADGTFDPKGNEGETEIEPWVKAELMEHGDENYLLHGTLTERTDHVFRRLNERLRAVGMTRRLPTHELRKLFGSFIATTRGLFCAQKMLRHQSAQLTSDDYADQIVDELVMARWKISV